MLEVVFSIFVLCLAIVGMVEIFRIISLTVFKTKDDGNAIFVIPMFGHNEEAEMILRNAVSNLKWLNSVVDRRIVCLDLGMDSETRYICDLIKREYNFIEIYSLEEFNNVMKQDLTG